MAEEELENLVVQGKASYIPGLMLTRPERIGTGGPLPTAIISHSHFVELGVLWAQCEGAVAPPDHPDLQKAPQMQQLLGPC